MRLFISLLLFSPWLYGQTNDLSSTKEYRGNFTVGARLTWSLPGKTKYSGERFLKSRPAVGGEGSFGYRYALSPTLFLTSDIGIGLLPINFHYTIENPENSSIENGSHLSLEDEFYPYDYFQFWYGKLHIGLEKQIVLKNKNSLFLGGGINLSKFFIHDENLSYQTAYYQEVNNTYENTKILSITISDTAYSSIKIAGTIEFGFIKTLKKGNKLRIGLVYNYSPFKRLHGTYQFFNLGVESKGEITYGMNYLGVDLSLILSKDRNTNSQF